MKKLLLASAVAMIATGQAYADYQFELGGLYTQGEIGNTDYDGFGIGGEFHFDRVDTSKGPLAEASFLDKSSSIGFGFISVEPDIKNSDDIDFTNIGGRFVTATNLIIEADYATTDYGNSDVDTIGIGVGTYLDDNTDLVVSYSNEDDNSSDKDTLSVALHGVHPMGSGAAFSFDADVGYIDTDNDNGFQVGVGATYYFTRMFGVGLNAGVSDVGDTSSDMIGIQASFFPSEQVELFVALTDESTETNNVDVDSDAFVIGANARF
jgi:hypothetical protein